MPPKETKKEIEILPLDFVIRYLRAAERYAPELVAHEVVQLVAGVRADDEMADFEAGFVLPQTKEVGIPASVAKTETREVIDGLEENFWTWWSAYAPKIGLLRPKNRGPRWDRIRMLASVENQAKADELARPPIKVLLLLPESKAALKKRPWNARRRTFCTYHVAKHQSAAKTALIMRHCGSAYTLHNSYRGLGVTPKQGEAYFKIMPDPVASPIHPVPMANDHHQRVGGPFLRLHPSDPTTARPFAPVFYSDRALEAGNRRAVRTCSIVGPERRNTRSRHSTERATFTDRCRRSPASNDTTKWLAREVSSANSTRACNFKGKKT